jgi:hypothetical protein
MPDAIDGEVLPPALPVPGPGRDSKYDPSMNEMARKLCLLGFTDKELGDFFGVCEATINNWKSRFPAFLESIMAGKVVADAEVADSLYRRATGEHVVIERVVKGEDGKHDIITLKQFVPGEVQAQRLWLLNRRRGNWRDIKATELSGPEGAELSIGAVTFKGLNG